MKRNLLSVGSGGVAYFEMPDNLLRAVDAVINRVSWADAVFEQADTDNKYQETPRKKPEAYPPPDFPFRLSFQFFFCHGIIELKVFRKD